MRVIPTIVRVLLAEFGLMALWLGVWWTASGPNGSFLALASIHVTVFVLAIAALPAGLFGLIGVLVPRWRRRGAIVAASSLVYLVCVGACGDLVNSLRSHGFAAVAICASLVVDAIRAYERAQGHPPAVLADLVPTHLPAAPSTGMGAFPTFSYFTEAEGGTPRTWRLTVEVGPTPIDVEYLEYAPGDAGHRSRFGEWELRGS